MKNWKKKIGLWLALLATVLFVGCGGQGEHEYGLPAETETASQSVAVESGQHLEPDASERSESSPSATVESAQLLESDSSEQSATEESAEKEPIADTEPVVAADAPIAEDGSYTSKEDVALYLETYGKLPGNFITKKEAQALGWTGGSLECYAPGKCIGGDKFGNYEGTLPEQSGRIYRECDIDTLGKKSRGAKRIVYSNDGLIYYTEDHYESFAPVFEYD